MAELLSCPFCGNDGSGPIEDALHIVHSQCDFHPAYDVYAVQCDRCTANMGYSESEDDAAAAWNTRASTQPAPAFPREAELIEGLRPFAQAAEDLEPDHHDTTSIWETPAAAGIDARHLRHAAALLQGKQP